MSNYLITGGAGFYGSILKESLLEEGHFCVSIDLEHDDFKHDNLVAIQGDIRDEALLKDIFSKYKFECVFHCAALLAHDTKEFKNLWTSNVDGTRLVADYAIEYGCPELMFISSNCSSERKPPNFLR